MAKEEMIASEFLRAVTLTRMGRRTKSRLASQSGFSLLELLIVLVIIGILAGIAVPKYMASTVKAKQTEAQELLHQIYLMEQSYFQRNDKYWIPSNGLIADKDSPFSFDTLGVEIMKSARYEYSVTGDQDKFIAVAVAYHLDDDPAVDRWQIDQTGIIRCVIDDAVAR